MSFIVFIRQHRFTHITFHASAMPTSHAATALLPATNSTDDQPIEVDEDGTDDSFTTVVRNGAKKRKEHPNDTVGNVEYLNFLCFFCLLVSFVCFFMCRIPSHTIPKF